MPAQTAERFIEALRTLEQSEDLGPITQIFSEDCRVGNIIAPEKFIGRDGARKFWAEYRGAFDTIESTFKNVIVTDDKVALEWTTRASATVPPPPDRTEESTDKEADLEYDTSDEPEQPEKTESVPEQSNSSIEYSGVSVLETTDGQITRFCAYFNPSSLGHQLQHN